MEQRESIAIIGLGFVGLPLARLFVEKGFKVLGIDTDIDKIDKLKLAHSYVTDISDEHLSSMLKSGRFSVSTSYSGVKDAKAMIICVPTPLNNKAPDLSYIISAIENCMSFLQKGQLIILESSTYPGTTEEVIKPMLEQSHFIIGKNLYLGYSPERIDPGNESMELKDIPKVISGVTNHCLQQVERLYRRVFTDIVPVSSPRVAEFTKMLENSQRLINISFVNELNQLANRMNVSIWEVIEAAKTKPMGFTPYYPSPGIGGHCIPVDPYFLIWAGKREGMSLSMIQHAGEINDLLPYRIVNHVILQLANLGVPISQASIGVIGLTYKKNVNDIREAAAIKIVYALSARKISVKVYDPLYAGEVRGSDGRFQLTKQDLGKFDIVLILVDHSSIPWSDVINYSKHVIDTRNVTHSFDHAHIERI